MIEGGWNGLSTFFPNVPRDISGAGRQEFTNLIGQDNQDAINRELDPNNPDSWVSKAENLFPDAPYNGAGLIPGFIDSLSNSDDYVASPDLSGGPITDAYGDEIFSGQPDLDAL